VVDVDTHLPGTTLPRLQGGSTLAAGRRQRERVRRLAALGAVAVATLDVATALLPAPRGRLVALVDVVPVELPQTAGAALVLVAAALCLLGRGLRRGQRLALLGTEAALVGSAALHLLRGLQVEVAVVNLLVAGLLWWQRAAFPVRPNAATVRRALVLAGSGAVVTIVAAIGFVWAVGGHQHAGESARAVVERLAGDDHAPLPAGTFVTPALTSAGLAILIIVGWLVLSPRLPVTRSQSAHLADRERARTVVAAYGGDTLAYFALRDDKQWMFSGGSVVAFAVRNGVCLVSPDPIGPVADREQVWADFSDYAERNGWSLAVVGASRDWLPRYEEIGLRPVYLGDEAILDCEAFTLEGRTMKSLRGAHNRLRKAGCAVSFHDPARLGPDLAAALTGLAGDTRHGDAERGFSMTLSRLFDPLDTGLLLTVARDPAGAPLGFIQWVPSRDIDGWSLDVMRRSADPDTPNGVTDFMVIATAIHLRERGEHGLGLNFAILRAILADESPGRGTALLQNALHRLSEHAQIESLWHFNEKYRPEWRPRYVLLDAVEHSAIQGLTIAEAEGVDEIPVIGRFLSGGSGS
jgi:lysyl-tRNA synthetase class 2